MAIETLSTEAIEGSTYTIEFKFKDEDKNLIAPYNLTWTLTDESGNIINNRENESISSNSIIYIILSGNDLTVGYKILKISGNYDSTYGNNLPYKDSVKFYVRDLVSET